MKTHDTDFHRVFCSLFVLLNLITIPDLLADNRDSKPDTVFSIHDTDQDGSLSRDEYAAFVKKMEAHRLATQRPRRRQSTLFQFDDIDSNADGVLTEDEVTGSLNNRLRIQRRNRYRWNGVEE